MRTRRPLLLSLAALLTASAGLPPAAADAQAARAANSRSPASAAAALPAAVDGVWRDFSVGGAGTESGPYRFRFRGPVLVTVADYLCRGDRYEVYDRDRLLGLTSEPAAPDACAEYVETPDEGEANPHFSSGTFSVGAGRHAIRLRIVESPYGGAQSAFRLDAAPTADSRRDCRHGGWRWRYAQDGHRFVDEADCIREVRRHR